MSAVTIETAVLGARQLKERSQALGDDVRVRGEQVVGQHLPVRQAQ